MESRITPRNLSGVMSPVKENIKEKAPKTQRKTALKWMIVAWSISLFILSDMVYDPSHMSYIVIKTNNLRY